MSLNWNVEDCVGRGDWSDRDHDVLDKLIWGTMTVGLYRITEDNLSEWLLRMRMERAHHSDAFQMTYQNAEYYIQLVHLRKFIGMRTNATELTRSKWLKELMERIVRSEESRFEWQKKELAKAQTQEVSDE